MFEGRKLDHIGLQAVNSEEDAKWYMEKLGFTLKGKFKSSRGEFYTWFVTNGPVTYEISQNENLDPTVKGKVDHIAINSTDIEADYKLCVDAGLEVITKGIEAIPSRWERGCRYFKVKSPNGEAVEINQDL
ncbi:MAG: VOC family protein [Lachnospiraceae bacterium]|nr:VOC family protein [Candidatus Darwinimomas equi]